MHSVEIGQAIFGLLLAARLLLVSPIDHSSDRDVYSATGLAVFRTATVFSLFNREKMLDPLHMTGQEVGIGRWSCRNWTSEG